MLETSESIQSPVKCENKSENGAPATTTAENIAYDPFNPDDSPDENDLSTRKIKFEIKSGVKAEKITNPSTLVNSPLSNKEQDTDTHSKLPTNQIKVETKSEPQASETHENTPKNTPKYETNKVEKPKAESQKTKTESKVAEADEANGKKPSKRESDKTSLKIKNEPSDRVNDKKTKRSKSPHFKKKSKTRSKSRSPRREKSFTKFSSHSSRRSRSNSKTRRSSKSNRKSSRDRSTRDHRKSLTQKVKRSRSRSHKSTKGNSRSPSSTPSKISHSNSLKHASSRAYHRSRERDNNDYDRTSRLSSNKNQPDHRSDLDRSRSKKSDLKPNNHIDYTTNPQKLSKSMNNEQKYSDYLIEEMINEEKQQVIDINKISLPNHTEAIAKNISRKLSNSNLNDENKKNTQANEHTSASKTNLDKRLDLIFGNSGEKPTNGNSDVKLGKTGEKKENVNKSLHPVHKEKSSNVQFNLKKEGDLKKETTVYDPEAEYKSLMVLSDKKSNEQKQKVNAGLPNTSSVHSLNENHSNGTKTNKVVAKSTNNLVLDSQEKIVDAAKKALKPYFISKKVSKDEYKAIMKKVVTKSMHQNKTGSIVDSNKVNKIIAEYISRNSHPNKKTK